MLGVGEKVGGEPGALAGVRLLVLFPALVYPIFPFASEFGFVGNVDVWLEFRRKRVAFK